MLLQQLVTNCRCLLPAQASLLVVVEAAAGELARAGSARVLAPRWGTGACHCKGNVLAGVVTTGSGCTRIQKRRRKSSQGLGLQSVEHTTVTPLCQITLHVMSCWQTPCCSLLRSCSLANLRSLQPSGTFATQLACVSFSPGFAQTATGIGSPMNLQAVYTAIYGKTDSGLTNLPERITLL